MSGLRSPYVPGWDCHGLPIEVAVEKKVGKVGVKVDAAEFPETLPRIRSEADRSAAHGFQTSWRARRLE